MKTAAEIRNDFLNFFADRGHRIVQSAPVVPGDDPTLLFTNAGMNQFKDVFLGTGTREYVRAADTQKCIRVSGKHNDLEEVGLDTYHHTFFEMLGNWSFGDYFKREAIAWAWEFMTRTAGIDGTRLYATVFGGDKRLGLPADSEAESIWIDEIGLPRDRVVPFGAKDNFWEMADTGPCGPCSEIHIDRGPFACDKQDVPGHVCSVNGGCARYVELWNLVFIQFNRQEDGSLKPLPANHVDTGMGFERLVSVLQGKLSNYDTDLFAPIFAKLAELTGRPYGGDRATDIAFRVIGDHTRTLAMAIADTVMPARDGRGYVLRRLLRRAARFGRQTLGISGPFIHQLIPVVARIYAGIFPEIHQRAAHIALVIEAEEQAFARTIDAGIARFDALAADMTAQNTSVIPGAEAYRLYHEGGFPRDLIDLMAREKGLSVNEEQWKAAELEHKRRSEGAGAAHAVELTELEGLPATSFLGYWERGEAENDGTRSEARIIKLIGSEALVLDQTPFYAESGGQVGDTGEISGHNFLFRVLNTVRAGDITVHLGRLEQGDLADLPGRVVAQVDIDRRRAIMANHTSTHLLHWALRHVLGGHATQQGSLVNPDLLRFDFTHPRAVTREELDQIELMVNQRIVENQPLHIRHMSLADARQAGATALFGEKYGEAVRVISINNYTKELCGGTHCRATGEIGAFRIQTESSIQAGVRRIVAVTREAAAKSAMDDRRVLNDLSRLLSCQSSEVPGRVLELIEQIRTLKKEQARKAVMDIATMARDLISAAEEIVGVKLIAQVVEHLDKDDLGKLADRLRETETPVAGLLIAPGERVTALAFASLALTQKGKKVHAGKVVKEVSAILGSGGGGRPDFAQGGGSLADRIPEALARGRALFEAQIRG